MPVNMGFAHYNFSYNNLGNEGAKMMAGVLKHTQHIVSLNLMMNKITADGLRELSEGLRMNHSLIDLNLSSGNKAGNNRNRVMAKGISYFAPMLAQNVYLQFLNLAGNSIGNEGVKLLLEAITQQEAITYLNIECNEFTTAAAPDIKTFLGTTKSCKVLILARNNLGDKGIEILADQLAFKRSIIENIDLSSVEMTRQGFILLMLRIKQNCHLKVLKVDNNQLGSHHPYGAVGQVLQQGGVLEEFSAVNCELTDNFGTVFCDCLRTNKNLRKFNFSRNLLGDQTAVLFAKSMSERICNLEECNFSYNAIGEEGGIRIGKMLTRNKSLKKIDLQHNDMMDGAGIELKHGITSNKVVNSLKVKNNMISLKFVDLIAVEVQENIRNYENEEVPVFKNKVQELRINEDV